MIRLLSLFIFLCSGNLFGQSLQFTVKDRTSGLPIPDVYVKVLNSNVATITDGEGRFNLNALSLSSQIQLSAVGYAIVECMISDTTTQIIMDRSSTILGNNVTITARRFETNQFNVSEAVTVLDSKELQQTTPRSTPEALMGSTGVWIQKTNHGGGSPIMRGLVGNQVLLMIDGIRLNNATYRYGPNQYLSTIDPGLIDRIEATRGNGSVLYGSDALGGVVQVISKTPYFESDKNHLQGKVTGKWVSGGMENSLRSELQWNGEYVAILGGFSARQFGDLVAGKSLGTLKPTGYREVSGDAKVLIKTGIKSVMTAAWQHHQQMDVPRYDQVVQGGYAFYNFDPQIRQLGYLRWETATTHPLLHSLRITGALNRSSEVIKSQKNGSTLIKAQHDIVDTWSGVAEIHSVISNNWHAQSGAEWYYDFVTSKANVLNTANTEKTSVRGSYADGATSSSIAIFSNHQIDLNKFHISAGGRLNNVTLSVDDVTFGDQKINPFAIVGNLGVGYNLHSQYRIFVSGNTGFRSPNVDDVSKFGAVESTVFEIPSGNLSPERSQSVETGMKINTSVFSGSFAIYKTKLFDLIERMPVTHHGMDTIENRRVYQKQNVSESALRGVEADGELKLNSLFSLNGNVTYTYGENISKNEPMRRIPPLFGKIGLRFQHPSHAWARIDYLSAGDQTRLAKGDLSDARISVRLKNGVMPSWSIVNLYAGYSYKFVSVTVSVQNLFDEAYRVYASGVDGYGRNYSVSLTGKF